MAVSFEAKAQNRENYDFSARLNRLFGYLSQIEGSYTRIALYGYGCVGRLIAKELKGKIVVIADRDASKISVDNIPLIFPENIHDYQFDCVLVSVLGREAEIVDYLVNDLRVDQFKIVTIELSADPAGKAELSKSISELDENIKFNERRWGQKDTWLYTDQLGYSWSNKNHQAFSSMAAFADKYLKPFTQDRYDLKVLELSPGGGRFTVEVMRYARSLDLVDMNAVCLELCERRFSSLPIPIRYFKNDGKSLAMLENEEYDLIVCFDSMVHMHPDIVENYVKQMSTLVSQGGCIWLDHSGGGARESGHRTNMTDKKMADFAAMYGLTVVAQNFRNDHDCITVLTKAS